MRRPPFGAFVAFGVGLIFGIGFPCVSTIHGPVTAVDCIQSEKRGEQSPCFSFFRGICRVRGRERQGGLYASREKVIINIKAHGLVPEKARFIRGLRQSRGFRGTSHSGGKKAAQNFREKCNLASRATFYRCNAKRQDIRSRFYGGCYGTQGQIQKVSGRAVQEH